MHEPNEEQSIKRIRESAFSMQVGHPEDGKLCMMLSVGNEHLDVLEYAIFAVQLADQVDPERTNAAVPNTKRRRLSYGAKDPAVGRILLTAQSLFKSTHLGSNFPEQRGLFLAFTFLQDILTMIDMRSAFVEAIQKETVKAQHVVGADRSIELPAVGDVKARCDAFAQKIGHTIDTMEAVAKLFYPKELGKKWIDSLVKLTAEKHGQEKALTRFMKENRDSMLFMLDLRNMIEHPKPDQHMTVHDFRLTADLNLVPPCVEIVLSGKSLKPQSLSSFMASVTEELLSKGELFFALLCDANVASITGLPLFICEIPECRRPEHNPHQRFSYGTLMNGTVVPML